MAPASTTVVGQVAIVWRPTVGFNAFAVDHANVRRTSATLRSDSAKQCFSGSRPSGPLSALSPLWSPSSVGCLGARSANILATAHGVSSSPAFAGSLPGWTDGVSWPLQINGIRGVAASSSLVREKRSSNRGRYRWPRRGHTVRGAKSGVPSATWRMNPDRLGGLDAQVFFMRSARAARTHGTANAAPLARPILPAYPAPLERPVTFNWPHLTAYQALFLLKKTNLRQ